MSGGFVKLKRGPGVEQIATHHPTAFILLTFIAWRAYRGNDVNPHGLKVGQSLIGDHASYGMTRQQYRTALNKLKKWRLVTTQATTKGTIATIISTDVYDVNLDGEQPPLQPSAQPSEQPSEQPLRRSKEVRSKKYTSPYLSAAAFEEWWKDFFLTTYPKERRDGKKQALRSLQKFVKCDDDLRRVERAVEFYLNSDTVRRGFCRNGSTFFNNLESHIEDAETPGRVVTPEAAASQNGTPARRNWREEGNERAKRLLDKSRGA